MYKLFFKRLIDVLLSIFAIVVLLPLLIPVALILLCTGEHYIFYFQERIGFKNKPFYIYKFATMLKNSPNMGNGLHTKKSDPESFQLDVFLEKLK